MAFWQRLLDVFLAPADEPALPEDDQVVENIEPHDPEPMEAPVVQEPDTEPAPEVGEPEQMPVLDPADFELPPLADIVEEDDPPHADPDWEGFTGDTSVSGLNELAEMRARMEQMEMKPDPLPMTGGKGGDGDFILVEVTATGSAGSSSSTCAFTYSIKIPGADEALATDLTPDCPRYTNVEYVQPSADSPGVAYQDAAGNWCLYHVAEEVPKTDLVNLLSQYQIDGTNKKFQVKYRKVRVLEAEDEDAAWTDVHTGTTC